MSDHKFEFFILFAIPSLRSPIFHLVYDSTIFDALKKFFKTSTDILDDCQRNDKVENILMESVMGKVDESLFSEEETSSQSSTISNLKL